MSRVADYSIVQDGPLTVNTDVQSRKFNVPPNLHEGSRGILSFVVTKLEDVEEGSLLISINDKSVYTATYNADFGLDRGVQEVFAKDVLEIGENVMEINGNPGGGTITIADIVVWFQVDSNIIGGKNKHGDLEHGSLVLRKDDDVTRIRLDANSANLRMGGSGTDGDILLYPSDEDILAFEKVVFATIHLDAEDATLRLGKIGERGKPGKILLRGGDFSGGTRIRLDASSANLRMGGSGADGDIMLFTAAADSDSAATEASIHLNAGGGQAWGGGTIALRGGSPQNNRIVLNAIAANIVVGGNGQHGDLYVFPGTADHAPVTQATIHLDGQTGDVSATSFTAGGIQLDVPDYVWDSNYALMPIEELRAYTAREKRLPNMPSAAEIKREGLNLSQFQMQLLEKIEELTRYLLMQQETIEAQQAQIDALGSELQGLTHGQR